MKKRPLKTYLWIGATVAMLLALSVPFTHKLQGIFFTTLHPLSNRSTAKVDEFDELKIENTILHAKLNAAESALNRMKMLTQDDELLGIHFENLKQLFSFQMQATPAFVIGRTPKNWNSKLWIGVGSSTNSTIKKNSPVVVGDALIGIVDEVHKNKSLVRLITDPKLIPSVRAARGGKLLAKGELHGSKKTTWRKRGTLLEGEGFNYDFEDSYGPARDLRTGAAIDSEEEASPILRAGDLLVTSGLDGLFPEGLKVATVTSIHILREGDYYYDIEAAPYFESIEELSLVYVLPSLGHEIDTL